jgi:hypothetical protein
VSTARAGAPRILTLGAFASCLPEPVPPDAWRPAFLRLRPGERPGLELVCRAAGVEVVDTLARQFDDLAAAILPAGTGDERRAFVEDRVATAGDMDACGTWVWIPWERRLVHLLDEDDYVEVITNRNRDKITREEQALLRSKRVGVVGLSVGGEAAVAIAQEHLCGEMVLADFDALDLSNLNRLGAGFDDLGLNKAVIVARRIMKIDPYLRLIVYTEGVTAGNADAFLDGLDLLLEECDGLALKYEIRAKAKERGIDVLFAGDERGFLSVEPYGQCPDLEPFHGRLDGPQRPRERDATPVDFWRALTVWLGGWDAISEQSRRSLLQIGSTLCGYPQLSGEARYAAGQLAWFSRRLLLGEAVEPFVGHLDLDELVVAPPAPPGRTGR